MLNKTKLKIEENKYAVSLTDAMSTMATYKLLMTHK